MGKADNNGYKKRKNMNKTKKAPGINDALAHEALELSDIIDQPTCWKAYHLDYPPCRAHPPSSRKQNCRDHPYCIHRLGLERIDRLRNQQSDHVVPELVRRDIDKQPCGLVNFGNFCYVNSFLQIWYNDLVFRQCVYNWRPDPDFRLPDDTKMDVQAVMNSIQELFLTMQFTPYETASALDLIRLLKLDNEQHDVQEFNTLFFDALDRNLERHPNGDIVRFVIQRRFESRIRQTIECRNCGVSSDTESEYRSLQISIEGHVTLSGAIRAFFSSESLSDYKCEICRTSGNVIRHCEFSKLPPILIIQFNRYTFDANGRHKKLKTPIQYLRTLPAKALKADADDEMTYELSAVMIHEGPNTHCGHYYDLIRHPGDDQWFKYNDKNVLKMTKPPGVAVEKENIQRVTADMRECYALIYQRNDANENVTAENLRLPLPDIVRDVTRKLNDKFSKETKDGDASLSLWKSQINDRHAYLTNLWKELEVNVSAAHSDTLDLVFLPTNLLSEILKKEFDAISAMRSLEDFTPPSPMKRNRDELWDSISPNKFDRGVNMEDAETLIIGDNDFVHLYSVDRLEEIPMSLCIHDKVPFTSVVRGDIKAVNRKAAQRLLGYYRFQLKLVSRDDSELAENFELDFPHLMSGDDICVKCIEAFKQEANFMKNLEETRKLPLMKKLVHRTHNPSMGEQFNIPPPEDCVWVSHRNLLNLKSLAKDQLEYDKRMKHRTKQLVFNADNAPENLNKAKSASSNNENNSQNCNALTRKRKLDGEPIVNDFRNNNNDNADDESAGEEDDEDEDTKSSSSESVKCVTKCTVIPTRLRSLNNAKTNAKNIDDGGGIGDERLSSSANSVEEWNSDQGSNEPSASSAIAGQDNNDEDATSINGAAKHAMAGDAQLKRPAKFNEELYCEHGGLTFSVKRTWITLDEWEVIRKNFLYYAPPIPISKGECEKCASIHYREQNEKNDCQKMIDEINRHTHDIFREINHRRWEPMELGTLYTHVICHQIIRESLRKKNKLNPQIPQICQDCLLCEHEAPYKPLKVEDKDSGTPITGEEWQQISHIFDSYTPYGPPVAITLEPDGSFTSMCLECNVKHIDEENNRPFVYPKGEFIFVRLKDDENDAKELKSTAVVTTRRLASRRALKFNMCSTDRIIDLKMKICAKLHHTPLDQLLYLNDVLLENDLTLEEARVSALNENNPLTLIVQQTASSAGSECGGLNEPRQLERGFRDTALAI